MKRIWIAGSGSTPTSGAMAYALGHAARSTAEAHVELYSRNSSIPQTLAADEFWITCKRPDLEGLLKSWKHTLLNPRSEHVPLLFLQNGLGIEDQITPILGDRHFTRVACWWGARWLHSNLQITPPPRRMSFAGTADAAFWTRAGFEVELLPAASAIALEWRKGLTNLTLNALLALERSPNGALIAKPELLARAKRLHEEARGVALALGVPLPTLELTWAEVLKTAQDTPQNRNSLLQDLETGRQWELPWLNAWLVERGHHLKLKLPEHESLVRALESLRDTLG